MLYRKALTLKQLRALAAIVDSGSITAAAGVLHVTPPAVSTRLRGLEAGRLVTLALEGIPILRTWYLIRLADTGMSPVAAAFRKFLLELEGDYLPALPEAP